MSSFGKFFTVIAIVAAVIGLGLVVGFWGTSRTPPGGTPLSNDPAQAPVPGPVTDPNTNLVVRHTNPGVVPSESPGLPTTNGLADWESKVDAILTSEIPDNEKAKKMLEMFPLLSPEAQEEVAHHLSNLVPDEEYAPLGSYLTNSAMPEAVLDVLLEDVFNRPNSLKLPRLLDIARNPLHPKASESKDVLELFLEEDFGTDWNKWQDKMDAWLKQNPD